MKILATALIAAAACALSADPGFERAPRVQGEFEIGEPKVVCRQENRYLGWPTVIRRRSGELVAVFSGDRQAHLCPFGKVQMIRSRDSGETWSAPETIVNSPLDDRDAGIVELSDGSLVLFWFNSWSYDNEKILKIYPEFRAHTGDVSKEDRARLKGSFSAVSNSDGRKWSVPARTCGIAPHGGNLLSDGRLLIVGKGAGGNDDIAKEMAILVGESRDGGRSWKTISKIEIPEGDKISDYWEPHVVEASDGSLVAHIRCHKDSRIRQSVSRDGGKTWSVAKRLEIVGFPSHLLRLSDGSLLMTYSRRAVKGEDFSPAERSVGIFARFSENNGADWGDEIQICKSNCSDMGYPSTAELGGGKFITVFYHNFDANFWRKKQKCTGIIAVKWQKQAGASK